MVRRHPQVGQYAVDLHHAPQPQRPAQEPEIALHEMKTRVVGPVGMGVAVLVERKEPPSVAQLGENPARMTAPAERQVGVGPLRLYGKQLHGFFEQYRGVVSGHGSGSKSQFGCKVRQFPKKNIYIWR